MTQDSQAKNEWSRLAYEMRAYRHDQQSGRWGVDDMVLARYLANMSTPEECRIVEHAMASDRELREAMSEMRGVLAPPASWSVKEEMRVLAQHLSVWIDRAGQCIAAGLEGLRQATPAAFSAAAMSDPAGAEKPAWTIPIPEANYEIELRIAAGAPAPTREWRIWFQLTGANPDLVEAGIKLARPGGFPTVMGKARDYQSKWLRLDAGEWQLTVHVGKDVRVIPVALGREEAGT